jgi:hypothetical protein
MTTEDTNDDRDDRVDEARATFRITGDMVVPVGITRLVGLDPSRSWSKGDEHRSRSGQVIRRHSGAWTLSFSDREMASAVARLLEAVEPRLDAARLAAREADGVMSVGLWWDPAARQGGFTMSSDLFRRLAALGERIDIYFPG